MKNSNPRIEALPWPQGELAVYRWPEGQAHQPRGVVLLVHGLGEHMGRYSETAHFLQEEGWICIGYDHLGHGRSAGARGTLPSGWRNPSSRQQDEAKSCDAPADHSGDT
ncbi:MAG: hypothetical protein EBX67_08095 [Betaproteobacteria bacterium]|nr:hypothetical protein [Betaproteobacteria bacterium]